MDFRAPFLIICCWSGNLGRIALGNKAPGVCGNVIFQHPFIRIDNSLIILKTSGTLSICGEIDRCISVWTSHTHLQNGRTRLMMYPEGTICSFLTKLLFPFFFHFWLSKLTVIFFKSRSVFIYPLGVPISLCTLYILNFKRSSDKCRLSVQLKNLLFIHPTATTPSFFAAVNLFWIFSAAFVFSHQIYSMLTEIIIIYFRPLMDITF